MALFGQKTRFCLTALAFGLVVGTVALPQPASAGFLDRLFGDVRRAIEGPSSPPPSPLPSASPMAPSGEEELRADTGPSGPAKAFCVRTCDGHFFPVASSGGQSAAESCRSFCPATETRVYGGSNIDTAVAPDGRRYADLPNAFVYRKAVVAGCTCNGKNAFGLARLDASNDPTLRPGDLIATKTGVMAYNGSNGASSFTPVNARASKAIRDKLQDTRSAPPQNLGEPTD